MAIVKHMIHIYAHWIMPKQCLVNQGGNHKLFKTQRGTGNNSDDAFFVQVHVYDCHEKPRGSMQVTAKSNFTCRQCGTSTSTLSAHCSHLAHHRSSVPQITRVFTCVYCDCRSDNIEMLEEHVASNHPSKEMKFQVLQSSVCYLQASIIQSCCLMLFSMITFSCVPMVHSSTVTPQT